MIKRIGGMLMLALCIASLSACVVVPGPGYYGHAGGGWVPAHYNGWH